MAQRTSTAGRRGTTAPVAPTRLPSTRERRPAMAALAVLLIVGGALASGWLALRSGDRADYLRVNADVAQGEQIDSGDLDVVSLPDDLSDQYMLADREGEVLGKEATTPLRPGMVLTEDLLSDDAGTAPGRAEQALQVPEDAIPAGTTDGSSILVVLTNSDPDAGQPKAVGASVVRIERPDEGEGSIGGGSSSAVASVTVSFPAQCSGVVGQASYDGAFIIQQYSPEDLENPNGPGGAVLHPCSTPTATSTTGG